MTSDIRRTSADVSNIVSGTADEYIVTHPGRSQYSQIGGGASACGLAALNCARIVLGLHQTGLGSELLVRELMERRFLEDVLRPCLSWSSPAHLSVDEIYKAPIFEQSLKMVHTSYGQPTFAFFQKLILSLVDCSKVQAASSCVVITRPPEIIACFYITDVPAELFVIFDSHPRPDKHPHGAAFIFKNSVNATAEYLTNLLRYDERLLADSTIQWQAQLLAHASGDVFVANSALKTDANWAELALDASLQVLSLQARTRELEMNNRNLEADNKRLNDEISDMEDKVSERDDELEALKVKYDEIQAQASTASFNEHPIQNRRESSPVTMAIDDVDPVAVQMQIDFDKEDNQLQRQFQHLKDVQPTFFDCGICWERYQNDHIVRMASCGHPFCRPCVRGYAASKIGDHRYPILCPTCTADRSHSDPAVLDDFVIQQLGLTDRQYEIFSEMQLAAFSTIIHCRRCLNTIFVDKVEYQEAKEIVCPLPGCGHAWCKLCSQALEIGGPKHSCDGSSELNHLMAQRGWKHCPGCQTPAEKIDGCNHMTCMSPSCNAHFCYLCGDLIVQSVLRREIEASVSRHYRRCTLF